MSVDAEGRGPSAVTKVEEGKLVSNDKAFITQLIVAGPLGKNDPANPGNDAAIEGANERYSKNIYYYWHQFYRAYWDFHVKADGPDQALIRRVKRDFKLALEEDFRSWWFASGKWLFANKYDDEKQAIPIRNARELRQFKDGMLVFLPFDGHFPDMIKEIRPKFEDAVEDHYLKKPRLKRKYELYSTRYEIAAIRNQLTVYRAVMADLAKRGSDRPTVYRRIFSEIDESLILNDIQKQWGREERTHFMHRNFKRACRLIYHVARGQFPNPEEPPVSYMPPRNLWGDEGDLRSAAKAAEE